MQTDVSLARTPSGRRIEVTGEVAATPDRVWDLLTDTRGWPEWGPTVTAVDCPDRWIRQGSTGHVQVAGGPYVPFEITLLDADRRRWTWSIVDISATGHRVDEVVRDGARLEDRCRVVFEVPLLAAGYVPVCKRAIAAIADLAEV